MSGIGKNAGRTPSELLDELMRRMHVRKKDVEMIRLYGAKERDAAEVTAFFSSVEPDREDGPFLYMASRLGARCGWEGVPKRLSPLLAGLRRKAAAENAVLLSDALSLIRALGAKGVPVLVVKGGAMKLGFAPDKPQKMKDVDIVVPKEAYGQCVGYAAEEGFTAPGHAMHSADLVKENGSAVDLHYRLFKSNVQKDEPFRLILGRGRKIRRGGASFYVPSPEDMALHLMVNGLENYLTGSGKGPVSFMADLVDLTEKERVSWEETAAHAKEYGVEAQFRVAAHLVGRFLPDAFPGLSEAASGGISKRTLRRLFALVRFPTMRRREMLALEKGDRLRYLVSSSAVSYVCLYHLGDPLGEILIGMPDMMKRWTRTEHLLAVPLKAVRIIGGWQKKKGGYDVSDQ